MQTITIATFNVNSIKARLPNVLAWLDAAKPDIALLQELKCVNEAFPAMEIEERGYNLALHGQKTYNGVAILSKFPLDDVIRGLPEFPSPHRREDGRGAPLASSNEIIATEQASPHPTPPPTGEGVDTHARYIEAVVSLPGSAIRVASVYVPNGQAVDSDKFPYKLKFLERLRVHWQAQLAHHEIAVLGGDFNAAPAPIDVYDAAKLDGTVCYHPAERERLRALTNLGLYDAFRALHPHEKKFSWWDYRGNAFEAGHGLRIDHLLLSPMAADRLRSCHIDETPRMQEKPSDHAPVVCSLIIN